MRCIATNFSGGMNGLIWVGGLSVAIAGATRDCDGQLLRAQVIAQRGEAAPGFPNQDPPLLFEDFGTPTGFVSPEPIPAIDRQGNVTFVGILSEDGIPSGQPIVPAVFRFSGGTLHLVAKPGDPAPGTNSVFAGFPGPQFFPLESTPLIFGNKLVMAASTEKDGNNGGIWSDRFGDFELIVRPGDALPGAPGTVIHSFADGFEGTDIVINAAINNAATDGLWRKSDGEFEVIAIDGVPAPGVQPGITFGEGTSLAFFGAVDGWDLNESGEVVFNGYLQGPPTDCGNGICETAAGENCLSCPQDCNGQQSGNPANRFCCGNGGGENPVGCNDPRCTNSSFACDDSPLPINENNDEGIWAEGPSGLQLIMREGDAAPQAGPNHWFGSGGNGELGGLETFGPDTTIASRINDHGELVMGARITSPQFYFKLSLWTTRNGPLELLALGASGLGDPNFPGDPAPGLEHHQATFSDFIQGDLSNDGVIAFRAAAVFPGQQLNSTIGIWWDLPGKMTLIAALGEPIPDIDGLVYEDNIFPFPHASSDWDWVLYAARFTGSGGGSFPLFRATADGDVSLVLQSFQPIELSTGEVKTVLSYQVGAGHSDDGRYVLEMTFTDGTHGVYVVDLIPPFATPGDINGDGVVNVSDLLAVIESWGPCPAPPANCDADIAPPPNGDAVVNVFDLLMVINNWG